jgi:hypothetical protein
MSISAVGAIQFAIDACRNMDTKEAMDVAQALHELPQMRLAREMARRRIEYGNSVHEFHTKLERLGLDLTDLIAEGVSSIEEGNDTSLRNCNTRIDLILAACGKSR